MLGAGLALVARHASQRLLVALVAAPLCAFLGGSSTSAAAAAAPLQSACALALTLLEIARLTNSAEELVLSAVAVGLFLIAPHPTPPSTLALALASACVVVAASAQEQQNNNVGGIVTALLALDFAAAYVDGPWTLLLLLTPIVALQALQGGVSVARWGLFPALLIGAHAHVRAMCRPSALYALVGATVLALCAQSDPLLELSLLAMHAGARWFARREPLAHY
jgi:hypothetical protein